jgi:O-antigen/teichoic acid export membrane protein
VVLEAVFSTIGAFVTRAVVYKSLPYLKEKVMKPGRLRFRYPQVLQKVKYLSFHNISNFAGTQISPIIIYAYSSLSMVALYGNYIILTGNLASILSSVFSGVDASVGNMVAEGNRKLKLRVFGELFSSRFFIIAACSICLWLLANPFISLWLGPEYIMGKTTVFLIVAAFFLSSSRMMVQGFVDAHGDFSDIWSPLTELGLNVGLCVLGGWYYGLNGILACSLVSQLLLGHIWKPYFLFCRVMKEPLSIYIGVLFKNLIICGVGAYAVAFIFKRIPIDASASVPSFLLAGTIALALCLVIMGGLLYAFNESARGFVTRIVNVILPGR